MERSERYKAIISHFRSTNPRPEPELKYRTPFQLLVAVMLSAQCTDKRVNMVTRDLFAQYPDALSLAKADEADIRRIISSVSYPNSKANHLSLMAKALVERFSGQVPSTMEDLITLKGVGRKTANVVLATAFGEPMMAVDTHVFRVSHRLGLVDKSANTPAKVEEILTRNIPSDLIPDAHHWLLLHGRYTCLSRKPKCPECPFSSFCPSSLERTLRGKEKFI